MNIVEFESCFIVVKHITNAIVLYEEKENRWVIRIFFENEQGINIYSDTEEKARAKYQTLMLTVRACIP